MKYKIKQGMIFGILFLILAGAMLILAEAFKNAITAERMAAARTVEAGFNRSLDETFGNLNHAVKLFFGHAGLLSMRPIRALCLPISYGWTSGFLPHSVPVQIPYSGCKIL